MVEFIVIFLALYIWHALGVTVGYHRLLSHRAFACPKWVEYFFVLGGYLAFEGSPIWWATIHRAHHRYVDTPLDPHAPKYGLKEAHVGWLTHEGYPDHINPQLQAKDLLKDPVYRFLDQGSVSWMKAHRLAMLVGITLRIAIFLCFGWVAALASLLAALAVLQIPLMLNVVCHIPKLGYKRYATDDDSVNVWWVAVLAMGEGWHNNHHASPGSAKTGMAPWEFDMSWQVIKLMRWLNIATRVNECTHEQMMRQAQSHNDRIATRFKPSEILVEQLPTIPLKTASGTSEIPSKKASDSTERGENLPAPAMALTPDTILTPQPTLTAVARSAGDNVRMLPNTLPNAIPVKHPGTPVSLPAPAMKLVPVTVSLSSKRRDRKVAQQTGYRQSR